MVLPGHVVVSDRVVPVGTLRAVEHKPGQPNALQRSLASHASERCLGAAVGRGFCDERHDAAPDCVRPEADRQAQVD